jgi:hypothetical protein
MLTKEAEERFKKKEGGQAQKATEQWTVLACTHPWWSTYKWIGQSIRIRTIDVWAEDDTDQLSWVQGGGGGSK